MPGTPEVIALRNVSHLCTDIAGTLDPCAPATLLQLAAAVHPTAAVGGTPRDAAVSLIAELEGMDRGRYAGPVGWVDGNGDGELGIALRCAQLDGSDRPAVRRLRGGGRLRPGHRGARSRGQDARRPRRPGGRRR